MIFKTIYIYFVTRVKSLWYRFKVITLFLQAEHIISDKTLEMQIGIITYGRRWSCLNLCLESSHYLL